MQLNLLDPETNYFYAGTYLGTKKILSLGGSVDFQEGGSSNYRAVGADALIDLPVGPGAVTTQLDLLYRNGGSGCRSRARRPSWRRRVTASTPSD